MVQIPFFKISPPYYFWDASRQIWYKKLAENIANHRFAKKIIILYCYSLTVCSDVEGHIYGAKNDKFG
jgi:hypothetical protein